MERDYLCETRDTSSVSSTASLEQLASDYCVELPTSGLFCPPDVDDTFLIATGHDTTSQRSERAEESGNARCALSSSISNNLHKLESTPPMGYTGEK